MSEITDIPRSELNKTYLERHGILTYVKVEPIFDRIRNDKRYDELLRRLGLAKEDEE